MARQIDKKTDSTLFAVSFNKSVSDQWLYASIMESNPDTKCISGGSKLVKVALKKYFNDLGIKVPDNERNISKMSNNSSKIENNPVKLIELDEAINTTKDMFQVKKDTEQEIQDDDIGNGFIDI